MAYSITRRVIATVVLGLLAIGACLALRWIWRDITYWQRSVTVAYKNPSLEECVRVAVMNLPGVSASFGKPNISLHITNQEGVVITDTATPKVARIIIFGHSSSISHLGPASEGSVKDTLAQLSTGLSTSCNDA